MRRSVMNLFYPLFLAVVAGGQEVHLRGGGRTLTSSGLFDIYAGDGHVDAPGEGYYYSPSPSQTPPPEAVATIIPEPTPHEPGPPPPPPPPGPGPAPPSPPATAPPPTGHPCGEPPITAQIGKTTCVIVEQKKIVMEVWAKMTLEANKRVIATNDVSRLLGELVANHIKSKMLEIIDDIFNGIISTAQSAAAIFKWIMPSLIIAQHTVVDQIGITFTAKLSGKKYIWDQPTFNDDSHVSIPRPEKRFCANLTLAPSLTPAPIPHPP